MLALDHFKAADPAANVNADVFRFFGIDLELGHVESKVRGGDRKVHEPRHLLDLFFVDEIARIEILDFAGDAAIMPFRVKKFNPADAVLSGFDASPSLFRADSQTTDETDTSHYNSTRQKWLLILIVVPNERFWKKQQWKSMGANRHTVRPHVFDHDLVGYSLPVLPLM